MAEEACCPAYDHTDNRANNRKFAKEACKTQACKRQWIVKDELDWVNYEWLNCKVNHAKNGTREYADFWSSP
jgi:hypothetical protein